MKPKTGLLKISRKTETMGLLRGLEIYLNEEKIGSVAYDKTFEIELLPNEYQVHVKMDWCFSRRFVFHIASGEVLNLEATLNGSTMWTFFAMIFNTDDFFSLAPIGTKSKRKNDEF